VRGIDVILEIDWQGARQIRRAMGESVHMFVLPPSWRALERRLRERGTDAGEVIEARMRAAGGEIAHFSEFDYLVVNDDFDRAVQGMRAVVHAARLRLARQQVRHAALIRDLLAAGKPILIKKKSSKSPSCVFSPAPSRARARARRHRIRRLRA
jgi:guanylate kinase